MKFYKSKYFILRDILSHYLDIELGFPHIKMRCSMYCQLKFRNPALARLKMSPSVEGK